LTELAMTRRSFQVLADLRAEEARVLLNSGRQQGAFYLVGYAVECALKACIAKRTKRHDFPIKKTDRIYSHNLASLLVEAELETKLEIDMKKNLDLATNWNVVKEWKETSRYERKGLNGKDLYKAVTGTNGVLPWIKNHW